MELLLSPFPLPARWQQKIQKNAVGMSLEQEVPFFLLGMPYGEMKKIQIRSSESPKSERRTLFHTKKQHGLQ